MLAAERDKIAAESSPMPMLRPFPRCVINRRFCGNERGIHIMKIARYFTQEGKSPYADIAFRAVCKTGESADESSALPAAAKADIFLVPAQFSQSAAAALLQNGLCPLPIPAKLKKIAEKNMPEWLWRSEADDFALRITAEENRAAQEKDARQIFNRLAGAWTYWGWQSGLFHAEKDARAFHDEICFMLAAQRAAPDLPQWANTGLYWAYGLDKPAENQSSGGQFYCDAETGAVRPAFSAYERPQMQSCFIQSAENAAAAGNGALIPDALLHLWQREAAALRRFACAGGNFSALPGAREKAAGFAAQTESLLPLLRLGDSIADMAARRRPETAGGGRAAKMVVVNADHPDIEAYIDQKTLAEQKRLALQAGEKSIRRHQAAIMRACADYAAAAGRPAAGLAAESAAEAAFCPMRNPALKTAMQAARRNFIPESTIQQILRLARQKAAAAACSAYAAAAEKAEETAAADSAPVSAYALSLPDSFLRAVEQNADWPLIRRADGSIYKQVKARALWDKIALAAWRSAAPELHFATGVNTWHTAPAAGDIHAAAPDSGYMFLDNTAAHQAVINLGGFLGDKGRFDSAAFAHAVRLWTLALEVSVSVGQYPSEEIARKTQEYRPLALSYSNFGSLLRQSAAAYDSDAGRALCAAVTALMTGAAYAASAELAAKFGAFKAYARNAHAMLRVMRNHRRAAYGQMQGYEQLPIAPAPLRAADCPQADLAEQARAAWDKALRLGEIYGFRHAQISALATAATVSRIMDCAATGLMPVKIAAEAAKAAGGSAAESRIRMMAAAQAFLSGGIAETIALPNAAPAEDCAKAYMLSWKLGLKANALCREAAAAPPEAEADDLAAEGIEAAEESGAGNAAAISEPPFAAAGNGGDGGGFAENLRQKAAAAREELPNRRQGYTQQAVIGSQKITLHTSEFKDGRLGEIFIDMPKADAAVSAMLDNFAIAVSLGLQYGVPLEDFVSAFTATKFAPSGPVQGNNAVKKADSVLDYIFRELAVSYLGRHDLAQFDISGFALADLREGESFGKTKLISTGWEQGFSLKSNIAAKMLPFSADFPPAEAAGGAAKNMAGDSDSALKDYAGDREHSEIIGEIAENMVFPAAPAQAKAAEGRAETALPAAFSAAFPAKFLGREMPAETAKRQSGAAAADKAESYRAKTDIFGGLRVLTPFSALGDSHAAAAKPAEPVIKEGSARSAFNETHFEAALERSLIRELFGALPAGGAESGADKSAPKEQSETGRPHKGSRQETASDKTAAAETAGRPLPQSYTAALCPHCRSFTMQRHAAGLKCTICGLTAASEQK